MYIFQSGQFMPGSRLDRRGGRYLDANVLDTEIYMYICTCFPSTVPGTSAAIPEPRSLSVGCPAITTAQ